MTLVKVQHEKSFTCIDNKGIQDKNLSLSARGLLIYAFSLPDDWNFSINGLVSCCKEGRTAISSTLKELESNGYLIRTEIKDDCGKFLDTEYKFFEVPYTDNMNTDYEYADGMDTENPQQQSIYNTVHTNPVPINPIPTPPKGEQPEIKPTSKNLRDIMTVIYNSDKITDSVKGNLVTFYSNLIQSGIGKYTVGQVLAAIDKLVEDSNGIESVMLSSISESYVRGYKGVIVKSQTPYYGNRNNQRYSNNNEIGAIRPVRRVTEDDYARNPDGSIMTF